MSWPAKILLVLFVWALAFAVGYKSGLEQAKKNQADIDARHMRDLQQKTNDANRKLIRVTDEYIDAKSDLERNRAVTAERLRQLSSTIKSKNQTAGTCGNHDATPAIGVVSDAARENFVELAAVAERVSEQLRACQKILND